MLFRSIVMRESLPGFDLRGDFGERTRFGDEGHGGIDFSLRRASLMDGEVVSIMLQGLKRAVRRNAGMITNDPEWIRTTGLSLRRAALYPVELRGLTTRVGGLPRAKHQAAGIHGTRRDRRAGEHTDPSGNITRANQPRTTV